MSAESKTEAWFATEGIGFGPIVLGEYRATFEPIPIGSVLGFRTERWWVIRCGQAFVGMAQTPRQVQEIVTWAQAHPKAA
jgi:hypothetical protein